MYILGIKSAKVKNKAGKINFLRGGGKFSNFRSHGQGELQGGNYTSVKT